MSTAEVHTLQVRAPFSCDVSNFLICPFGWVFSCITILLSWWAVFTARSKLDNKASGCRNLVLWTESEGWQLNTAHQLSNVKCLIIVLLWVFNSQVVIQHRVWTFLTTKAGIVVQRVVQLICKLYSISSTICTYAWRVSSTFVTPDVVTFLCISKSCSGY